MKEAEYLSKKGGGRRKGKKGMRGPHP